VLLEALGGQRLQQSAARVVEDALARQDLREGAGLIRDPGPEGLNQGRLVDQAGLESQQADEDGRPRVRRRPRRHAATRRGAEGRIDRVAVAGEPVAIVGRLGPLAPAPPRRQLRGEQVAEQGGAISRLDGAQLVLEPGSLAAIPGQLEAVTDPVDPIEHRQG
jgi:hypothetical protein